MRGRERGRSDERATRDSLKIRDMREGKSADKKKRLCGESEDYKRKMRNENSIDERKNINYKKENKR